MVSATRPLFLIKALCFFVLGASASAQTFTHPRDQIALQLGAIQMGYDLPFALDGSNGQQAVNALVMGRNAMAATAAKPALKVQGAVWTPNVDTVEFRDQLYSAVEYVVTSPVAGTIRGAVRLENDKRVPVPPTRLVVPPSSWTTPVPFAVEAMSARTSADAQELAVQVDATQTAVNGLTTAVAEIGPEVATISSNTGNLTIGLAALQEQSQSTSENLARTSADGQMVIDLLTVMGALNPNFAPAMITVEGGSLPGDSEFPGSVVATFQIGKYEVTLAEWQEVRTWAVANGYDLADVGGGAGAQHPVTATSWYDAIKWCNAKSQKDGLTPVYLVGGQVYKTGQSPATVNNRANGHRLPTQVEWEWAARGGVSSRGYAFSGSNNCNDVGWNYDNISGGAKAVGTKMANELAIHDMSGNVAELCEDWVSGIYSRARGGDWSRNAPDCSIDTRSNAQWPFNRYGFIGFRLARNSGS